MKTTETELAPVDYDLKYDGGECPKCGSENTEITFGADQTSSYQCNHCGFEFTVEYKVATLH